MNNWTLNHFKHAPPKGCRKCSRLVEYRRENKRSHPQWCNQAIGPWGSRTAKILIIGLAPGLKGANRTGRIFTGDQAGKFLFESLREIGLVEGHYQEDGKDNLASSFVAITNAIACVPPKNQPTPEEFANCLPFLRRQIKEMTNLEAIFCLGTHAHIACLKSLGLSQRDYPFSHGAEHQIALPQQTNTTESRNITIFDSYHCSRYNTQTRRLTTPMFHVVLKKLRAYIDEAP